MSRPYFAGGSARPSFFYFKSAPLGPTGVKTTGIPRCPRPRYRATEIRQTQENFKYKTRIDFNAKKYENSIVNGRTAMGRGEGEGGREEIVTSRFCKNSIFGFCSFRSE